MNPRKDIAAAGKARANAFMAQFADYEKSPAYQRRKKALDDRLPKTFLESARVASRNYARFLDLLRMNLK